MIQRAGRRNKASRCAGRDWRWFDRVREIRLRGGLGGDESLDAGVQAGLVAAGGVLVQDTLLHALVQDGDSLRVGGGDGLLVAGNDGLAQDAQGAAELALVGTVGGGLGFGLTCALQRGDMICHGIRNSFLVPGRWRRRNWEQVDVDTPHPCNF